MRNLTVLSMQINEDMSVDTYDGNVELHHSNINDFVNFVDKKTHNFMLYTKDINVDAENILYCLNNIGYSLGHVMKSNSKKNPAMPNVYSMLASEEGKIYSFSFRGQHGVAEIRSISNIYTGWSSSDIEEQTGQDFLHGCLTAYIAAASMFAGKLKITLATQAYADFKSSMTKTEFDYYFPELNEELDDFIRRSYHGGLIIAPMPKHDSRNEAYEEVVNGYSDMRESVINAAENYSEYIYPTDDICMSRPVDNGELFISDKNSMYPYYMANYKLPICEPIYYGSNCDNFCEHVYRLSDREEMIKFHSDKTGLPLTYEQAYERETSTMFFIRFKARLEIKKNHVPFTKWPRAKMFDHVNYISDMDSASEFYMTEMDYMRMCEVYEVHDIEFIQCAQFMTSSSMFRKYINYWFSVKDRYRANGQNLQYKIAKLMMNALSGKFAQYAIKSSSYATVENGRIKYESCECKGHNKYIPVASAITSYGRCEISGLADLNYDILVGGDTDSIFTSEPASGVEYGTELGKFKLEHHAEHSIFIGRKTYAFSENGKWEIKCAGMGKECRDNVYAKAAEYDEILKGTKWEGLGMGIAFASGKSYSGNYGIVRNPGVTAKSNVMFTISEKACKFNVIDGSFYEIRVSDSVRNDEDEDEDLPF